jgi:serine/threonine protein kinase
VLSQVKQILDEYRLEAVLRTTVYTTVFRASDPDKGRQVIIKLINPGGPVAEAANKTFFIQSLKAVQGGEIKWLPRIVDFGFTPEENAFTVAEVVPSTAPLTAVGGEPLLHIAATLAKLLDAADELAMVGIPHLNLCPENVLLCDNAIRLTGFGTAPYLIGAPSEVWPPDGARYTAPELFGPGVLGHDDLWLADLYSLALIICDVLGVEVRDPGTAEPIVKVKGAEEEDWQDFESVVAAALRTDPATRSVGYSELRRVLTKQEFPAVEQSVREVSEDRPEAAEPVQAPPHPEPAPVASIPSIDEPGEGPEEESGATAVAPPGSLPTPPLAHALPPPSDVESVDVLMVEPIPAPEVQPVPEPHEETGADPYSVTKPSAGGRQKPDVPWIPLAVAGAVAAIVVVVVAVWLGERARARHAAVQPVVQRPTATAVPAPVEDSEPSVHPLLEQAQQQFADGDVDGARVLLEALSDDEIEMFSAEENKIWVMLSGSVGDDDRGAALDDLRAGLRRGSIQALRRGVDGVAGFSAYEISVEPGLEQDVDRARAALRAHEQLWNAKKRRDHLGVIERSDPLIKLLPEYSGSYKLREEAAAALEAEAERRISQRDFSGAVSVLEGLDRVWPNRDGLMERMEWCRQQRASDDRMMAVLERALTSGRTGDPEAGLRELTGVTPSPPFAQRFAEARQALTDQLAAMDAAPPEIFVPSDLQLKYRKNMTFVVPITVTDDYRIERVAAHFRRGDAAGFSEVTLRATDNGLYPFEITPQIHGNKKFYFFVVAVDRSGHRTSLGDAEQPMLLQKKGWLK